MPLPAPQPAATKKRTPILARHAISLAAVFMLALPLSYVIGNRVYRASQLDKLTAVDPKAYAEGFQYVETHVTRDEVVLDRTLEAVQSMEQTRARDLLVAVCYAYDEAGQPIPDAVVQAFGPLMHRLDTGQAIVVYDWMLEGKLGERDELGPMLLNNLQPEKTDQDFLLTVDLLDERFLWLQEWVPHDQWVRWLTLIAQGSDRLGQEKAARLLGELPESLDDPRIADTLLGLADSEHPEVRSQVLDVCVGYAAVADDPTGYEQVIFRLCEDEDPAIVRRAWLIIGHLNPVSGYAADWAGKPSEVAEAMLWAAAKTNPESAPLIFEAYDNGLALEAAHAIYALSIPPTIHETGPKWTRIADLLSSAPQTDEDILLRWRYLPNLHRDWQWLIQSNIHMGVLPEFCTHYTLQALRDSPNAGVINAIVYYARVGLLPEPYTDAEPQPGVLAAWLEGYELERPIFDGRPIPVFYEVDDPNRPDDHVAMLSYGSNDRPGSSPTFFDQPPYDLPTILTSVGDDPGPIPDISVLPEDPVVMDLWVTLMYEDHGSDPGEEVIATLEEHLRGYETNRQIAAALYAGMAGLHPRLIKGVTADFLRTHPEVTTGDIRAMTDEQLIALGLERVDALPAMLDFLESRPPTRETRRTTRLLQLALWMRGDLGDDFTPTAEAMLLSDDLPTSTVLMCLLYKRRPVALEYLFGDMVSPRPDLHNLFVYQRWWHVYRRFVDTSDTPLWLWGDPGAQAFQFDSMRQWYAVNRWRLEEGWWPGAE